MFFGEYQHSIDPKGRIILPSKLREGLGVKFMLTKGFDKCLFGFSMEEWGSLDAKLRSLPMADKDARAFVRFLFAGAAECEADKQGRVLIPQHLRDHASMDKDVAILGMGSRVEFWDRQRWEEYSNDDNLSEDKLAEKWSVYGI